MARVKRSEEAEFIKKIQLAISTYYKKRSVSKLAFHQPTLFRKDDKVITLNLEPTGEDRLFLTGLHQHLLDTIDKQIHQDEDHKYTPHLTMFTDKDGFPIPDLCNEELQLCNSNTIHMVDGVSEYAITQPIRLMPSALTVRRLGTAEVITSLQMK